MHCLPDSYSSLRHTTELLCIVCLIHTLHCDILQNFYALFTRFILFIATYYRTSMHCLPDSYSSLRHTTELLCIVCLIHTLHCDILQNFYALFTRFILFIATYYRTSMHCLPDSHSSLRHTTELLCIVYLIHTLHCDILQNFYALFA